jgi:hypothetical protein
MENTMQLLPTGVTRHQNKYRAQLRVNGKNKTLGTFDCVETAHRTYRNAKRIKLMELAKALQ